MEFIARFLKGLLPIDMKKTEEPTEECPRNLNRHFSKDNIHMADKYV